MCIRDSIQGKVIGINTSIFGKTFQGISFAVPSSTAEFVFEQLVTDREVKRGYLGLAPGEITVQRARSLGLPDHQGAYVLRVTDGSPAYHAGIQPGDILRHWQGVPIKDYRQVYRFAEATPMGSEVTLEIWRSNEQRMLTTTVTVGQSSDPPLRTPSEFSRDR